jgi:hypothetical protein
MNIGPREASHFRVRKYNMKKREETRRNEKKRDITIYNEIERIRKSQ